jgi:SagB-type dehydrogenase family enzyme
MQKSTYAFILMFGITSILFPFYQGGLAVSFAQTISLPKPKLDGTVTLEKTLQERRSVRSYRDEPLTLTEVSQILWAAQGITEPQRGLRTAPSARAQYFIEVYLVAGKVSDLPPGLYKYQPRGHELLKIAEGDKKADLYKAAGQASIQKAPVALLVCGLSDKAAGNPTFMYLEAGHVSQNVYLQSVSLGLGTVAMAGIKPEEVKRVLNLPEKEVPIYVMPLGKKGRTVISRVAAVSGMLRPRP